MGTAVLGTALKSDVDKVEMSALAESLLPYTFDEPDIDADSKVLQLFEGRVLEVDDRLGVMNALLVAKIGQHDDHVAEIELQWVMDQDRELVKRGAIFYFTISRSLSRHGGSIRSVQEIRFRRRPTWSRQQIANINREAQELFDRLNPTTI